MQCANPQTVFVRKKPVDMYDDPEGRHITVPCGKCLICLQNKRKDWIFRLEQEHKHSKGSMFVTLTYSPKYCPDQLEKVHLQLFFKRLRKHEKSAGIRYFAVGEYGGRYGRPHYHILLFNADMSGDTVRKAWTSRDGTPLGLVHIGHVAEGSIKYCTKYLVQYDGQADKKPFTLMSRRYGIGGHYLSDSMVDWHRSGDKNYVIKKGGEKARLPKFYKDKIWYGEKREKVGHKAKWDGIREARQNLRLFKKKFGPLAKEKMAEFRAEYVQRIKTKVAYSQTL